MPYRNITLHKPCPTTTELATAYDEIAHLWDGKIRRLGYDRAYQALFSRIGRSLLPTPNATDLSVLDCGIGTGALSLALAKTTPVNLWVQGVDISSRMIAEAARRLREQGIDACLETRHLCNLPYADNQFELVMSAHTIEHLADPDRGLREMVRVLQPGAPFLLITPALLVQPLARRSVGA